MTRLFTNLRMVSHGVLFVFSLVVLAMAATLASNLLSAPGSPPKSFIIYSLIISAATILALILLTSYSQPRTELVVLFILAVGWVAEGAWATDIIGNIQCQQIASSSKIPTERGNLSARTYCYEVKTIMAFAWTLFALFTIFFLLLISLTTRAHSLGRPDIWSEPIAELPWYGQYPGYEEAPDGEEGSRRSSRYDPRFGPYAGLYGFPPGGVPPQGYYPMMAQPSQAPGVGQQSYQIPTGGFVVQQQPGHSVVIQPGQNGQATVSQVPAGMVQHM